MKLFNKITIIGVGLIGGSIGLAIKRRRLAKVVCGVGRRVCSLNNAKRAGAIDVATLDLEPGVKDADLIIIATPVSMIIPYIRQIKKLHKAGIAKKGLIVTDVGSTKSQIAEQAQRILHGGISFIPGHPFAGSEKSKVQNASADLFEGAAAFLTPIGAAGKAALRRVSALWRSLGSRVIMLSPQEHDELVAQVSHLPHILATALVNATSKKQAVLSSTGFKDTTRIAAGDPAMWRDICLSNSKEIAKAIERFKKNLDTLAKAIKEEDVRFLMQELQKAKRKMGTVPLKYH